MHWAPIGKGSLRIGHGHLSTHVSLGTWDARLHTASFCGDGQPLGALPRVLTDCLPLPNGSTSQQQHQSALAGNCPAPHGLCPGLMPSQVGQTTYGRARSTDDGLHLQRCITCASPTPGWAQEAGSPGNAAWTAPERVYHVHRPDLEHDAHGGRWKRTVGPPGVLFMRGVLQRGYS